MCLSFRLAISQWGCERFCAPQDELAYISTPAAAAAAGMGEQGRRHERALSQVAHEGQSETNLAAPIFRRNRSSAMGSSRQTSAFLSSLLRGVGAKTRKQAGETGSRPFVLTITRLTRHMQFLLTPFAPRRSGKATHSASKLSRKAVYRAEETRQHRRDRVTHALPSGTAFAGKL